MKPFFLLPIILQAVLISCCVQITIATSVSCDSGLSLERFSALYGNSATQGSITIPSGKQVLFDVPNLVMNGGLTIPQGASLYFDWQQTISLTTQYILVNGGLYFGTASCPIENKITVTLVDGGNNLVMGSTAVGRSVIATGSGAILEMHGAKGLTHRRSWTQLARNATAGSTFIELVDEISTSDASSWTVGDHLVIPSTDFSPLQTEEVVIKSIVDNRTVELEAPLSFNHFGAITFDVDERAEVGLLTRNIKIQGTETLGAHLIITRGSASAIIEGVEFVNVGQDEIARYPVHFHMVGQMDGIVRYNSIHKSNFRCVTIHGTHGVLVDSNVAFDCLGHCFYLEDGVEQNNTFSRNLAILTKPKPTGQRIGSDFVDGISSFWITNPNNRFIDNVAAAGSGTGFWIHVRLGPRGLCAAVPEYASINPSNTPLLEFSGNRAHSLDHAFQIEATYFDANDNPKTVESPAATYGPRNQNGKVPTYIDNLVAYKIRFRGIWARVDDIIVRNSTFADCYEGVQVATSGAHPPAPSIQVIEGTLFVGLTENKGTLSYDSFQGWDGELQASYPLRGEGLTGWKVYDGTQGLRNCRFVNYPAPTGGKVHAAIGIRSDNHGQVATRNFLETTYFINTNRSTYFIDNMSDGGKQANFKDDGSLSGYANAHILHNLDFFKTSNCQNPVSAKDNWIACPHRYNQLWVLDMARSTANNNLLITRNQHVGNDHANYQMSFKGFPDSGVYRYQPLVSEGASYLVQFKNFVTSKLAFELVNAEQGDTVELAICYPRGSTVKNVLHGYSNKYGNGGIPSKAGTNSVAAANNRNALNNGDSYYWDADRSMLFITVKQSSASTDYGNFCPNEGCDFVWVEMTVPDQAAAPDCTNYAYSGLRSIQETSGQWLNQKFK